MQFTTATIVGKQIWSDGLFTLQVDAPEVEPFEAGQYLQIGVPRPDKHLHRPYSVASPHSTVLDFFIVRVDDGRLTPTLWSLTIGDRIDVATKAIGSFTLSGVHGGSDLWLVGTGTGLAPYIAMLRSPETWQRFTTVRVVHGVRHTRDLAYLDELAEFKQLYGDRFSALPVVSRESSAGRLRGRITEVLANGSLEEAAGGAISPHESRIMLCGNPDMLSEMETILTARGMTRHTPKEPGHIIIERYW